MTHSSSRTDTTWRKGQEIALYPYQRCSKRTDQLSPANPHTATTIPETALCHGTDFGYFVTHRPGHGWEQIEVALKPVMCDTRGGGQRAARHHWGSASLSCSCRRRRTFRCGSLFLCSDGFGLGKSGVHAANGLQLLTYLKLFVQSCGKNVDRCSQDFSNGCVPFSSSCHSWIRLLWCCPEYVLSVFIRDRVSILMSSTLKCRPI